MARRRRGLDLNLPFIEEEEEEEQHKDFMEILDFEPYLSNNIDLDINADADSGNSDQSLLFISGEEDQDPLRMDLERSNPINRGDEVTYLSDLFDPVPDSRVLNLFPRNPGVLGRNQERGLDSLQLGLGLQSWFDSSSASGSGEGYVSRWVELGDASLMMNEVEVEQPSAAEGNWFDQFQPRDPYSGLIEATQMVTVDHGEIDWNIECAEALAMIIDNHEEGGTFDAIFNGESMSWDFDTDVSNFFSMFAELHPDFELEQLPDMESVVNHSVPTAAHVIENLPSVTLTQDDVKNKNSVCSICTDEFSTEEKLKRLPCFHYYHGDCILPWLKIQNTCPVCRYKLPTR